MGGPAGYLNKGMIDQLATEDIGHRLTISRAVAIHMSESMVWSSAWRRDLRERVGWDRQGQGGGGLGRVSVYGRTGVRSVVDVHSTDRWGRGSAVEQGEHRRTCQLHAAEDE